MRLRRLSSVKSDSCSNPVKIIPDLRSVGHGWSRTRTVFSDWCPVASRLRVKTRSATLKAVISRDVEQAASGFGRLSLPIAMLLQKAHRSKRSGTRLFGAGEWDRYSLSVAGEACDDRDLPRGF